MFAELQRDWPSEDLFKDDGFTKPRHHGQRPHLRKLMCYSITGQSKYFDKYMVKLSDLPESWASFTDHIMTGNDYRQFIKDCFKIKDFHIRCDWHLTCNGRDVSPHVDSPGKEGSHLMYFMPEGWTDEMGGQTAFYKDKLVLQDNPESKDFGSKVSYPNVGNTSLLFKNSVNGWHGVYEVNSDLNRQIFNVVILKA
jgi:hypothetical protein